MKISLICAMATNGVIGKNNGLPWYLPEDLRYFKATTMGHAIIMGRKTWESIGRPLPGRSNIVVTGNSTYQAEGAKVVSSVEEAINLAQALSEAKGSLETFVIGGAAVYAAAMPVAARFHLTRVHAEVDGDTVLTGFKEEEWYETSRKDYSGNKANPYDYSICVLNKQRSFNPSFNS